MKAAKLFELDKGDRFYFPNDPKRNVYEVLQKIWKSPIKPKVMFVETTDRVERHQNRDVVFIRNVNLDKAEPEKYIKTYLYKTKL
jgi:hypothetical protein